jgi:cyclase
MSRLSKALILLALTVSGFAFAAAQIKRPAGVLQKTKAYRFNKITEDVYHAVGTGAMTVGSNSVVIINENDLTLVDSHISPAAAWVLLDEVKAITTKPVRYVINTHFHYDHAHGNQVYDKDVEIIGHEFTRDMLIRESENKLFQQYRAGLPGQIENLKNRVAAETDAARKAQLQSQLESAEANRASQDELRTLPPTITLKDKLTLHRGSREIQLIFLGRGHTGGDVVVYLPKERIVCSGDLMTNGLANMVDGFADEWVGSLEELKKLEFDRVLPGHGEAFMGKEKITAFQAYLRDIWAQVGGLKRQGLPAEEAAKRVDMTAHKAQFPNIQGPGADVRWVARIYEVMDMPGRSR